VSTYIDDVTNEDWLRGNSWDIRLADGRLARTLDEVAHALGTTDIQQVAMDLLRLPSGKAAPDDLKLEAVTYLAQMGAMADDAARAAKGELDDVEVKKLGGLGKVTGGIHIGGWWGARGFSEALVVRDPEGRFVDRLGYGGIPDAGATGHRGAAPEPPAAPGGAREIQAPHTPAAPKAPEAQAAGAARDASFRGRVSQLVSHATVPAAAQGPINADEARAPGHERRAVARANRRQRVAQAYNLDRIVESLPRGPLRSETDRYSMAVRGGNDVDRVQAAQILMEQIDTNPQGSAEMAVAALINPQDVLAPPNPRGYEPPGSLTPDERARLRARQPGAGASTPDQGSAPSDPAEAQAQEDRIRATFTDAQLQERQRAWDGLNSRDSWMAPGWLPPGMKMPEDTAAKPEAPAGRTPEQVRARETGPKPEPGKKPKNPNPPQRTGQAPKPGTDTSFGTAPLPHRVEPPHTLPNAPAASVSGVAQSAISTVPHTEGRPSPPATGTVDDPIDVKGDLNLALKLLAEDKHVRLHQPDEVASMLDILNVMVDDAVAKGEKAPVINLCNVSVPGTNLFCAETLGIPRQQMPQVTGEPEPGSIAAQKTPDARGEVDMMPEFLKALEDAGIGVENKDVLASHLRASQGELKGSQVAGMTRAMEAGNIPEGTITVTRDGYIVDGHHRWAMLVNIDAADGHLGDLSIPVRVLDMDIGEALDYTKAFTTAVGIKSVGITGADIAQEPIPPKGGPKPEAPKPKAPPTAHERAQTPARQAEKARIDEQMNWSMDEAQAAGRTDALAGRPKRDRQMAWPGTYSDAYDAAAPDAALAKQPGTVQGDIATAADATEEMLSDQQNLAGRMVTTPTNFDPLDPSVDLSQPENYAKARDVWAAAAKSGDYAQEAKIRKAMLKVAKPGGIDFGAPVPGNGPDGQPWGSRWPSWHPRSDPAYDKYCEQLESRLKEAAAGLGDTTTIHDRNPLPASADGDQTELWSTERAQTHKRLIDSIMAGYADVPRDRRALILAGPSGSGKTTVLKQQGGSIGIDGAGKNFATLNPDDMKEEIIRAGLQPSEYASQYGIGPLEAASLLHGESRHLKNLLRDRLYDEGVNVILDGTFADKDVQNESRKVTHLRDAGYEQVRGLFVDGSLRQSIINAAGRHMAPPETIGGPFAGRYVPSRVSTSQGVSQAEQSISPMTGHKYQSRSGLNFEAVAPLLDGAIWVDNPPMEQSRIFHTTMPVPDTSTGAGVPEGKADRAAPGPSRPSANPGATRLREYWVHGEGAAKIKWGVPHDFDRCVRELRPYVGVRAEGLCNVYHREALGVAPGMEGPGRGKHKADTQPTETTDQPGAEPDGPDDPGPDDPDFSDSIMVALYPDEDSAKALKVPGGLPDSDLHVTLAYLGKISDYEPADLDDLSNLVSATAAGIGPIDGTINGVGKFNGDPAEGDPVYANVDAPGLNAARQKVADALNGDGFAVSQVHGFTPHITLAYDKEGGDLPKVADRDLSFDFLSLAIGNEVLDFPLVEASPEPPPQTDGAPAPDGDGSSPVPGAEPPTPPEQTPPAPTPPPAPPAAKE